MYRTVANAISPIEERISSKIPSWSMLKNNMRIKHAEEKAPWLCSDSIAATDILWCSWIDSYSKWSRRNFAALEGASNRVGYYLERGICCDSNRKIASCFRFHFLRRRQTTVRTRSTWSFNKYACHIMCHTSAQPSFIRTSNFGPAFAARTRHHHVHTLF